MRKNKVKQENHEFLKKDDLNQEKTILDIQSELSKKAVLECQKELEELLKKHNCRMEVSMMISTNRIMPIIQLVYGNNKNTAV